MKFSIHKEVFNIKMYKSIVSFSLDERIIMKCIILFRYSSEKNDIKYLIYESNTTVDRFKLKSYRKNDLRVSSTKYFV